MIGVFVQLNEASHMGRQNPIGYVITESGCWEWVGGHAPRGYGHLRDPRTGKTIRAHRYTYQLVKGPIPDELELDHTCRKRDCVNPDHLRAVTTKVNTLAGDNMAARYARRSQCKNGHELSPDNLKRTKGGWRRCKACDRERQARYKKP